MRRSFSIAVIVAIVNVTVYSQNIPATAYPVFIDNLWGYINAKGDVIIKPQFRSALAFSEGLAPARTNGTYGFIDISGNFIIQPQFDYAEPFYDGRARVYLDGKPFFIDKSGKKLFDHIFFEIGYFNKSGLAVATTATKKKGFIDKEGKLIIDTLYDAVYPFYDNRVVVISNKKYGVLDVHGRIVVPLNKFTDIEQFKNGYSQVNFYDADSVEHTGIIDTTGVVRFAEHDGKWSFGLWGSHLSDSVFTVEIYKEHRDSIHSWPAEDKIYYGAMNVEGKLIVSDTSWKDLTPFVSGRAFARDVHGNWYLVDKKARRLNSQPYKTILYGPLNPHYDDLFRDGKEIVETSDGWCMIDLNGYVLLELEWLNESAEELYRSGNILYYSEYDDSQYKTGYWNMTTGEVVSPQFQNLSYTAERSDMSEVSEEGRPGYINAKGIYVWRGQPWSRTTRQKINIDYMNRGYFYASSPPNKKLRDLGGWGGSKNMFMRIARWQHFEPNKLSSKVFTVGEDHSTSRILYVANTSKDTYVFDAQDSRLNVKLQALDKDGTWKDIEYLPSSWCGNSYHQLYLPPNRYWSFELPVYEGEFKTRLRAEISYKLKANSKESVKLYSQEFDGGVNPGQFWRKAGYIPAGIMDPYND